MTAVKHTLMDCNHEVGEDAHSANSHKYIRDWHFESVSNVSSAQFRHVLLIGI